MPPAKREKFKKEGSVTLTRARPYKNVGLIVRIERESYLCYTGDMEDNITVSWLGADEEERIPEFYLEKLDM